MSQAKVRIGPDIFLYREKAPFVVSGVSVHGALEYDEAADLVRCHECGEWHAHLAPHVWTEHGMKIRAYKVKHGLNLTSALCNERIRKALRDHGQTEAVLRGAVNGLGHARMVAASHNRSRVGPRHELRNRNGTCQAQILKDVKALAERLGRTPKRRELADAGIYPQSVEFAFGQTLRDVIMLAGLLPNERRNGSNRRYSKAVLIERLRDFWGNNKRVPTESDFRRGLLPCKDTYRLHFSTWERALFAAGLECAAAEQKAASRLMYSAEALESLMRGYIERNGFPSNRRWAAGAPELPTWKTFARYIPDMVEFGGRMRDYATKVQQQNEGRKVRQIA